MDQGADLGKPQFSHHASVEPVVIVCTMLASCYFNRRRGYSIIPTRTKDEGLLGSRRLSDSSDDRDSDEHSLVELSPTTSHLSTAPNPPKKRAVCGVVVYTPNSSRYSNYWHSRFLQKFPFLVEMFYWALNLVFYVSIKSISGLIFSTDGVWQTAQNNGVRILALEHESALRFFFPVREVDVQMYFRTGHQGMLTLLNRAYSLIHIPVTVSFLAWYYYAAPTHAQFAAARRMMSLTNLVSFVTFTTYPCMPPRLLPEKYGFFDTVRREDAESIWATKKFFNQLAAFPSLHFGYAFCIGTVLLYHSGIFRNGLTAIDFRKLSSRQLFFAGLSIVYPCFVLLIIVATANHYYLDAVAATGVVALSWLGNRLFIGLLPLEDLFLWCVKLEKPVPTTGYRGRAF